MADRMKIMMEQPSCDHDRLVCPAIAWAEQEIERLRALLAETMVALTYGDEQQRKIAEKIRDLDSY